MTKTYQIDVSDLSINLINTIKADFSNSTYLDITVTESMDETDYLLASEANRKQLELSFKQLEEGKGITFTLEEFINKYGTSEAQNP